MTGEILVLSGNVHLPQVGTSRQSILDAQNNDQPESTQKHAAGENGGADLQMAQ